MSHMTKVQVVVKDLGVLEKACQELGLQFQRGQRTHAWYGRYMGDSQLPPGVRVEDLGKCDHAIRVPGAQYEVGVVAQGDGSYRFQYDAWGTGGLEQALGSGLQRLAQGYAKQAVMQAFRARGKSVQQLPDKDGHLRMRVMA